MVRRSGPGSKQGHQLNSHCLLRKLTVKGLPCGQFMRDASLSADPLVFPRLNAQYRLRGMHESWVRAQFGEPKRKHCISSAFLFAFSSFVRGLSDIMARSALHDDCFPYGKSRLVGSANQSVTWFEVRDWARNRDTSLIAIVCCAN